VEQVLQPLPLLVAGCHVYDTMRRQTYNRLAALRVL
jgi:hypothetical protein